MKVSLNTLKAFNARYKCADDITAIGIDALNQKIGEQLGAIEDTIAIGRIYKDIVIVKVVRCIKHPEADRLHLCTIDDGGKVTDGISRDSDGYIQVVCGAPNVREGLLVAWLPPGSTVPDTFDKDPFVLSARNIRGQMSHGMLASPKELALSDNHEGILEIDGDYPPGTDFSEAFNLKNDIVFDIENKMFTHRPDCFGFMGISRELAGIQDMPFHSPDWYIVQPQFSEPEINALPINFKNELPELVPRFTAISMSHISVGQSPVWLQVELAKVGLRSINNIVDLTNFFMLETGQPLHAYDYDKVKALSQGDVATIVVRNPRTDEKIKLLNGKTIQPREEAIMIATDSRLIGVGGVMGGSETEVDDATQNIIIECANFDMYSIRRTSMEHGLFTDAVSRFNKGQSPLQNLAVLTKIVHEIQSMIQGTVASTLVDDNHLEPAIMTRQSIYPPINISTDFINQRLGLHMQPDEIKQLLRNVEFKIDIGDVDNLLITAPFWRTDIELREDIVEEVGRLQGYDKLPLELPTRSLSPAHKDELLQLKETIRQVLSKSGANELLTYSFVHGDLLEKTEQDRDAAFRLSNALSPSLQYYRLSLTPSLLEKVHPNVKSGYEEFAIFEIGKTHELTAVDDDGLPQEIDSIAFVYANNIKIAGSPFYYARRYLDNLAKNLGIQLSYKPNHSGNTSRDKPYEPSRSADVYLADSSTQIGIIGELKQTVRLKLKLPTVVAGFEISIRPLLSLSRSSHVYRPLSKFPKVAQDICLKVPDALSYAELTAFLQTSLRRIIPEHATFTLNPVDIYKRDDDKAHKQITYRLCVVSFEKTLLTAEVNAILDQMAALAQAKFDAARV